MRRTRAIIRCHRLVVAAMAFGAAAVLAGCRSAPSPLVLQADEATAVGGLHVGDAAPPIAIGEWLKGPPVGGFEPGRVYMLDFWAVWCGPCVASMGRTSALQDRHPDRLVVIAVTSEDPHNRRPAIIRTVSRREGSMRFRVAIDDGTATSDRYRRAVRDTALPRSFIIDGAGRLAWFGHPVDADEVVEACLAGSWDLAAAAAENAERDRAARDTRRLVGEYIDAQRRGGSEEMLAAAAAVCAFPTRYTQGMSPEYWAWPAWIGLLVDTGRLAEARAAAAQAAATPGVGDNAQALASIALRFRSASPPEAERLASIARSVLEAFDALPPPSDEWEAYIREGERLRHGEAYETIALIAADAGRYHDAVALQERAVARSVDDPRYSGSTDERRAVLERYRSEAAQRGATP